MSGEDSRGPGLSALPTLSSRNRGVSSTVGIALVVAITVVLAATAAGLVFGIAGTEQVGPTASLSFAVDAADDEVRVGHQAGDTLYADRTRIVWEIEGATHRSLATDAHQGLRGGDRAVFTFDGSTSTARTWTSYPSPGTEDIRPSDEITVSVYDTESDTRVFTDTFTAEEVREDI